MINLPTWEILDESIFPAGLEVAPTLSRVAGGSLSQFSHRTLDTYGVCGAMVADGSCSATGVS